MTVSLQEFRIPRMGSVENATVVSWRVSEGDVFAAGQVLCEVETDKTVTEVEAEYAGTLAKQLAAEGDELKVGDLIGLTAPADAASDDISRAVAAREQQATKSSPVEAATAVLPNGAPASPAASPAPSASLERISPLVRRLAKEHGIDLAQIRGSGPGSKITGDDVLLAAGAKVEATGSSGVSLPAGYEGVPYEMKSHSTRRRAIARRLSESARAAPHLTADMQIDMSALLDKRLRLNETRQAERKAKLSILTFIAHAAARLLPKHADLNATFTDSHQVRWQTVNLGVGVDTPDGLVVPVIRGAEQLSIEEMGAAIEQIAARARSGALAAQELEGGTFTISNPGALGPVLRAEAILNPPQVALLGLPGMLHAPVAVEAAPGEFRVEVRPLLRPSLTFDHRALDGGHVIRFLNDLKATLESN